MWQVPPPHTHPIRCVGAPLPYVDPNPNPNSNPNPMWQACPFPSAVALLLHRIKADLVAEKRRAHLELAATSGPERRGSSAPAFAPAQAAEISRIVHVVEEVLGSQARYLTPQVPDPTKPTAPFTPASPYYSYHPLVLGHPLRSFHPPNCCQPLNCGHPLCCRPNTHPLPSPRRAAHCPSP